MKYLTRMLGLSALAFAAALAPAAAAKQIVVDWQEALIYPLEDGKLVRAPIITNPGKVLLQRHLGVFRVSEKIVDKRSNMYNTDGEPIQPGQEGARMRYWMRFGWTAQGFHQSGMFQESGPRHRSNGCYRLSRASAEWLFHWTPVGTPIFVVNRVKETPRWAFLVKEGQNKTVAGAAKPAPVRAAVKPAVKKTAGKAAPPSKSAAAVKPRATRVALRDR